LWEWEEVENMGEKGVGYSGEMGGIAPSARSVVELVKFAEKGDVQG